MTDFASDVAALFNDFDEAEVRQCFHSDLNDLGAREAAQQFGRAERIISGLVSGFEDHDVGVYLVLCEALHIARKARKPAEAYAGV